MVYLKEDDDLRLCDSGREKASSILAPTPDVPMNHAATPKRGVREPTSKGQFCATTPGAFLAPRYIFHFLSKYYKQKYLNFSSNLILFQIPSEKQGKTH